MATNSPFSSDLNRSVSERKCTSIACAVDLQKNVLQCTKCSRFVHYQCSFLPAYQIQVFISNKRSNKFTCINCVDVSKDLIDLSKTGDNTQVFIDRIKHLEKDVEGCKNIMRSQQEKEINMSNQIEALKSKNQKLKEKSISSTTIDNFKKEVKEEMAKMGSMIKESIRDQMKSSKEELETKLASTAKSYAKAARPEVETISNDISKIIKQARQAEKAEEQDKKLRSNNIIIHGVAESKDGDSGDALFVSNFIQDIKVPLNVQRISRIGIKLDNKKRPLKVSFKSENEKSTLLRNLSNLKNIPQYVGISVTEDLTIAERSILKEWLQKAKDKNEKLQPESTSIWRVRGDSKNGYRLKEFTRAH